ncbi:calcium-binding protein [Paracoccus pantotrophus]|uniref:calcium-binding protein n=1 Tax=Paracoccus pantotrophus TaxID=82367 RepID=UPI0008E9A6BA|nr:hypothetical protein [Paracoccus pantotrophus]MDF3854662.1 hypothetical protein [Paracoccus pantotrophus]SFO47881.1 hypothetical protein SAMN04244567_01922 [Paracoccus pantotrophus]
MSYICGANGNGSWTNDSTNDHYCGGNGSDAMRGENGTLWGEGRDDILHGGNGDDRLNGQNGNDSLLGEDGRDRMNSEVGIAAPTGGEGPEALIADGAANIVTDFNAAEGIGYSRQLDNNPVDLSAFDHEQTLVAWNVAHL